MSRTTRSVKCTLGCCTLDIGDYISSNLITRPRRNKKAGGLIYDKDEMSILLIQSHGNLWGAPKGTLEDNESTEDGAIREIFEETGLKINTAELGDSITIDDTSTYFLVERKKCKVSIQTNVNGNDVNSIGWVKLDCMKQFIEDKIIKLTKHTELIIEHFLET